MVWLCRWVQLYIPGAALESLPLFGDTSASYSRYFAVKILNAHATGCIVGGLSNEFTFFKLIGSASPTHPGLLYCCTMLGCFILQSSAGGHICFVTDVLGSNLVNLRSRQPNQRFALPDAKRIIQQILLAIDYLHEECGYVHTGRYDACGVFP
jgi:serine/threonine-protein kinase SRPK3